MTGLPWLLIAITVGSWANKLFVSSSVLSAEYSWLYAPPENRNSNSSFAFSVALLPGSKGTKSDGLLLVSDPSANHGSGQVYYDRIPYNREITKGSLSFDDSNIVKVQFDNLSTEPIDRSVLRFGTSIAAVQDRGVVICAPGYNTRASFNLTAARGLCAYYTGDRISDDPEWFVNFFTNNEPVQAEDKDKALCLGGFSTVLLNTSTDVAVATSGPFCSKSGISIKTITEANSTKNSMYTDKYMYTGYSISSDKKDTIYATQPPTSKDERTVYIKLIKNGEPVEHKANGEFQILRTTTFGYMGYSSAVLHKSDNPKYLVLGSPYQSDLINLTTTDTGCVWLVNLESISIKDTPLHYCSSEQDGRFGTSIVSIGDLNNDKLEDFVVGCPGCGQNFSGAVYVFLTPKDSKVQLQPYQIFQGSQLQSGISGFGFSLAAGDVDKDLLPDLAVGSLSSGHVAVMLSKYVSNVGVETGKFGLSLLSLIEKPRHNFTLTININGINDYVFMEKNPLSSEKTFKKETVNLTVQGKVSELVGSDAAARFNVTFCNAPDKDGWCKLGVIAIKSSRIELKTSFLLSVLNNVDGYSPNHYMFREIFLRMRLRFISDITRLAFAYNYKACEDGICEIDCKFGKLNKLEKHLRSDIALKLTSPSAIVIDDRKPITVQLLVSKAHHRFYGGAAIKVKSTSGVSDDFKAECYLIDCIKKQNMILISKPIATINRGLLHLGEKQFPINVTFSFDMTKLNYSIEFELVSLAQQKDIDEELATQDRDPSNNREQVQISMESSLVLQLYIKHAEANTIDLRTGSNLEKLKSLKGRVSGTTIGPELKQIYAITGFTKPSTIVKDIELDVQVPFVLGDDQLLLTYFSKKMRFGARGQHEVPGQPYVSKFENGSYPTGDPTSSLCQPVEVDLTKLLFEPDVSLLEGQHKIMEHSNDTEDDDSSRISSRQRRSSDSRGSSNRPVEAASSADNAPRHRLAYMESLNCRQPNDLRCITFRCKFSLNTSSTRPGRAYLHLHSRLWSPTYFDQQLKIFEFTTNVHLRHKPDAIFQTANITNYANCTQTFLFKGIQMKSEPFPWGYVILGISIGLWLLLLFILLLWYCNFFKRRRPVYTAVKQQSGYDDDDHFYT